MTKHSSDITSAQISDITDAQIAAYRRQVVPDTVVGYHRRGRDGWYPSRWPDSGRPKWLTLGVLRGHLAGVITISANWSMHWIARVSHVVVDLDCHDGDEIAAQLRLGGVETALGPAHAIFRSSESRGLHAYWWLDDSEPALHVRAAVVGRLEAKGVRLAPGHVEVWPNASQLRLPLGRKSCQLDRETFQPIAATEHKRIDEFGFEHVRLVRDVAGSLRELDRRVRAAPCLSLADLSRDLVSVPAQIQPAPNPGGTLLTCRMVVHAGAGGSPAPVLGPGDRFRTGYPYLWTLRVLRGLSTDDSYVEYERWLRDPAHTSTQLTGRSREATICKMLRDARVALDRWDAEILAGSITVHPPRAGGRAAATMLRVCSVPPWRSEAAAALTTADHDLLAGVACSWLKARLGTLLGALRLAERSLETEGPLTDITIGRRAAHLIAGGKRPPESARQAAGLADDGSCARSAERLVLAAAVRFGVLRRIDRGVRGRRGSLYEVHLPGSEPERSLRDAAIV